MVSVEQMNVSGPTERAYCLLALHHQLVQLIELADNGLSLQNSLASLT